MASEDYRAASQAIWRKMAAGWGREADWIWRVSHEVGEWMVARLDPQPGETILELAAGAGDTGFAAAARLGDEGRLISTDFAPEMVEAAQRRAAELGIVNADFRVMDAERMDLEDDSVDGVLCRWGYMLMADSAAALRETHRVLRPGGRLTCSTWAEPAANPAFAIPGAALAARGHMERPSPDTPGIFAIATEARLRELLEQAGFERIEVAQVELTWRFPDADSYWRFLREHVGMLSMVLGELPADEAAAVRAAVEAELTPYETGAGYEFPGACLNAFAATPG